MKNKIARIILIKFVKLLRHSHLNFIGNIKITRKIKFNYMQKVKNKIVLIKDIQENKQYE